MIYQELVRFKGASFFALSFNAGFGCDSRNARWETKEYGKVVLPFLTLNSHSPPGSASSSLSELAFDRDFGGEVALFQASGKFVAVIGQRYFRWSVGLRLCDKKVCL
mmetsp:Transcript_73670/g.116673  ORF Transcript_73670/g.116673 Transcript_73670/m.116673 type:complete len:107 (-) Transcript_73670:242-562(-)